MNISLASLAVALALPTLIACASPDVACASAPGPDDEPSLVLVMFQDFASPGTVSLELAWEAAIRDPASGLREQFPFIARGLPEGTEVRLMVERRQDGSGQELHGPIVLSRRALRPEVIAVDYFADYSNGGGGVRILPEGLEGVDGLPVDYLCGSMDVWIEAEDKAGDLLTSTKTALVRSVADCAETPRTF